MGDGYYASRIVVKEPPPGRRVQWVAKAPNKKKVRVRADSWFSARMDAAPRLGVDIGLLEVRQVRSRRARKVVRP